MTYEHAIRSSALAYTDHLRSGLRRALPPATQAAARAALATTEAALTDAGQLALDRVVLDIELVRQALERDAAAPAALINECTPGLGTKSPCTVFVGKEAAYDATRPLNFMLESIALTALWLAEPRSASMVAVMARRRSAHDDFLREPGRLYPRVTGGHTWHKIGKVMELKTGRPGGPLGWGHSAYLVELSAVPLKSHAGNAPSVRRVAFLQELARGFAADGVRNVVMHSQERHHDDAQQRVAAAFLGVERSSLGRLRRLVRTGRHRSDEIEQWDGSGRRVLRCRHLSNSLSGGFLSELATLLL